MPRAPRFVRDRDIVAKSDPKRRVVRAGRVDTLEGVEKLPQLVVTDENFPPLGTVALDCTGQLSTLRG